MRLQLRVDELLSNMRSVLEGLVRSGDGGRVDISSMMQTISSTQISGESMAPLCPRLRM